MLHMCVRIDDDAFNFFIVFDELRLVHDGLQLPQYFNTGSCAKLALLLIAKFIDSITSNNEDSGGFLVNSLYS